MLIFHILIFYLNSSKEIMIIIPIVYLVNTIHNYYLFLSFHCLRQLCILKLAYSHISNKRRILKCSAYLRGHHFRNIYFSAPCTIITENEFHLGYTTTKTCGHQARIVLAENQVENIKHTHLLPISYWQQEKRNESTENRDKCSNQC